jgi:MFS family permease
MSEVEGAAALSGPATIAPAPGAEGRLDATRRNQVSVVLACMTGNMVSATPIIHNPFGNFLKPIAHEFGWPRAEVSGVLSVLAIITALAYPIVGRAADRFGPRRLIVAGNLLFGCLVIALGFVKPSVVMFYGLFALIGVVGSMPSTMMFNRVVSGWFDKTRGVMLGTTSGLGNGIGASLSPQIAMLLMLHFGWRGGFIGLGVIVLALGFPVLFFLLKEPPVAAPIHDIPPAPLQGMSLAEAAGTPPFWLMLTAIGLGAGCLTATLAHVVPMLTDRGFPAGQATWVVTVWAMVTAGWQIVVGSLLDRTGSPKLVAPLYIVSVVGMLTLELGHTLPVLIGGGALLGIGMGTEFGVLPYFISRYFGLRRFGAIAGVMYSAVVIAQGVTPYLMDFDFDHHRTYLLSLHVIDGVLVAGAAIIACLPRYVATQRLWRAEPSAGEVAST